MQFKTLATALVTAYAAIVTAVIVGQVSSAGADTNQVLTVGAVSERQVTSLLTRFVNGQDARKSDLKVVAFVLDSTNDAALEQPCGFDRTGNEISRDGDLKEAEMVGAIMYAPGAKAKAKAERTLSKHMGFCYLAVTTDIGGVTNVKAARSGAVKRVALALSKMSGEPVAIVDGKSRVTYNW